MPIPLLTVYYNTRCPVCNAGIRRQQSKLIALVASGVISFRDINRESGILADHGVDVDDVRRRLHAVDRDGRLFIGADVAIAIWKLTPGEGWLAALTGNPVALPVTRFVYNRFADILFAWNKQKGRW